MTHLHLRIFLINHVKTTLATNDFAVRGGIAGAQLLSHCWDRRLLFLFLKQAPLHLHPSYKNIFGGKNNEKQHHQEGTRAKIVQRESLNRIGKLFHLDQHVKASSHSSSHNSYISGNAVEAFVGAIYLDRGYDCAQKFIEKKIIRDNIDIVSLVNTEKNFKSRLIEWTQKYHVVIEYELVDTYCDTENNPVFRTAVLLGGIYAADATGYSKKESHQGASKKALERLKSDQVFYEQVVATAAATESPNL